MNDQNDVTPSPARTHAFSLSRHSYQTMSRHLSQTLSSTVIFFHDYDVHTYSRRKASKNARQIFQVKAIDSLFSDSSRWCSFYLSHLHAIDRENLFNPILYPLAYRSRSYHSDSKSEPNTIWILASICSGNTQSFGFSINTRSVCSTQNLEPSSTVATDQDFS